MLVTLVWKEYREHRSIWLTMAVTTSLLGFVLGQLMTAQELPATLGLTILALAAVYGVVCGAMMFAGEREGSTLVFLDIFLGRRDLLWGCKLLIGLVLVMSEAMVVSLALYLLKLAPPTWIATVAGVARPDLFVRLPGFGGLDSATMWWFVALPMVTLEAYAWGLLGSSMTQRVLSGAGLALVFGFHIWFATLLFPPPACLVVRLVVVCFVLFGSLSIFVNTARDAPLGPPAGRVDLRAEVMREIARELHREHPYLDAPPAVVEEPIVVTPILAPDLPETPTPRKKGRRPEDAEAPREVLLWLILRQGWLPLVLLGLASLVVGFFVPVFGQGLWPIATLLLGIGCGTATFAWEQSDLSYQFLAAQHFPLRTVWNVKTLFWFTAAVLGAGLLFVGGALFLILAIAAGDPNRVPMDFRFGTLLDLLGPTLFFGMWLAYGFCIGQVFVFLCKKTVYALLVSAMVATGVIGLWLPSLLSRGTGGWKVWLPPLAMILATRALVRAWAGGRIKERRPLAGLVGLGAAILVWAGLHFGWRAWEIPDAGQPLDRVAFRETIPAGPANAAAQKIQEALAAFEAPAKDQPGQWLALMKEVADLPPGVIEPPSPDGHRSLLRHLEPARAAAAELRRRAEAEVKKGNGERAFDYLGQILALSRSVRNKAPLESYRAGVEIEAVALDGLDLWLAGPKPAVASAQKVLKELDRHAAETPSALDCLQTECFRAGGALIYPVTWSFYTDRSQVRERWLAGAIAFSLDTPWETERHTRLWRAVWAGLFRALETPHWQLPPAELAGMKPATQKILQDWLSAEEAGVSAARLGRWLDASWLIDPDLFCQVGPLRSAATRSRQRLEAARLGVALGLYQLRNGKSAAKLEDLVPGIIPETPVNPTTGAAFEIGAIGVTPRWE